MSAFCGHNLTDHFPPPHAITLTTADYGGANVDLTSGVGTTTLPKNPCCGLLIESTAAAKFVTAVTFGGQTVTITARAAGSLFVRGSFRQISTGSTSEAVTVFWQ